MRIPQLSVVVDNKPGSLVPPCKTLSEAGINLITLSLAESGKTGTLRLIVEDWQQALQRLAAVGYPVTVTDVVAIEVRDEAGGMLELLEIFQAANVNVAYMYAFTSRLGTSAVLVFGFDDLAAAIAALTRAGINPVAPVNLYQRLDEK
jgi:hypothetical protein